MSTMWYENGRRYLDDCDWSLDPTVMQILALISMFHMAQRPATSSHYLDAALRIGEANNLQRAVGEVNQNCGSSNIKSLSVWRTIIDMNRILILGSAANDSIIHTLPTSIDDFVDRMPHLPIERALEIPDPTQSHLIRAQCNVAACAFGDLSDMLGGIQQQLAKDNSTTVQTCEACIFLQELETWLQSLPTELLLPTICESQSTGQELLEITINDASDGRKVELLHLYSLYFGTVSFLTCPWLEQVVVTSHQSTSPSEEDEGNAYRCLK